MKLHQKLKDFPSEYPTALLNNIRKTFIDSEKTIIVLDDDPTGTQACSDVEVLISWDTSLIIEALLKKPSVLFILTNSRSLGEKESVNLANEIGHNIKDAVKASGRQIEVVSRSDSTLRGHFPAEVDAIAEALAIKDAVRLLVPAFIEGGRYTIGDVHYIVEDDQIIPVSETPFAKDVVFGYQNADLKLWVEEKTKGKLKAGEVNTITLDDIRIGGPLSVYEKLVSCNPASVCIANAVTYRDLEVIVAGLMKAEESGKKFVYRTSATFVPIRAGLESGKAYLPSAKDLASPHGALIIVGSHVPKTTRQLNYLLEQGVYKSVEVNVSELLTSQSTHFQTETISRKIDQWLLSGVDVVLYTSRELEVGKDMESSLEINAFVSAFLVHIMQQINVRPKYILAKGGITANDIASKGLSASKALILGPIIPGVPLWQLEETSKFPGILYVVFPGNVGNDVAIDEVCQILDRSKS